MKIGSYEVVVATHQLCESKYNNKVAVYFGLRKDDLSVWRKVWLTPRFLSSILRFLAHPQEPHAHVYV